MKHLLLSLSACLAIISVDGRAAEPAKIELRLLKSVTVSEKQFLLGAKDGQPVTLAVELRLPTAGTTKLPAMVMLHDPTRIGLLENSRGGVSSLYASVKRFAMAALRGTHWNA